MQLQIDPQHNKSKFHIHPHDKALGFYQKNWGEIEKRIEKRVRDFDLCEGINLHISQGFELCLMA